VHGTVRRDGELLHVFTGGAHHVLDYNDPMAHAGEHEAAGGRLTAPMPGKVVAVLAAKGQEVKKGDPLVIMEAMKMEHTIAAPSDGWSRKCCTRSATRWPTARRCWPSSRGVDTMRILLYRGDGETEPWAADFAAALPHAEIVEWQEGETCRRCDYAVVWSPTPALLEPGAQVKAIFLMGAGADAILKFGDALPDVPIVRLGDAGMGEQMAEYVAHAVLRYFRRFDDYERRRARASGSRCPRNKAEFTVGVLGSASWALPRAAGAAPARLSGARLEPHAEGACRA
jgi:hypothetical protein